MIGEKWLPVAGYEGRYEVSDLGRVRSNTVKMHGRELKSVQDKKGYAHLVLCRDGKQKTSFVARLVAAAFVPNPDSLPDVNHKDFDKTNNAALNLEWVTHKGNIAHSVASGRYSKSLTAKLVSEIRTRAANGESQASIARDLGIRYQTVHLVVNRHSWRHIP